MKQTSSRCFVCGFPLSCEEVLMPMKEIIPYYTPLPDKQHASLSRKYFHHERDVSLSSFGIAPWVLICYCVTTQNLEASSWHYAEAWEKVNFTLDVASIEVDIGSFISLLLLFMKEMFLTRS